jgi:bilirubin oxidase
MSNSKHSLHCSWALLFVPGILAALNQQPARAAPLDPTTIPKYVEPLVIPPAMPRTGMDHGGGQPVEYYEIAVRQFKQQVLPPAFPQTTVWSYGSANHPATFNFPAFTIEAKVNKPVRVKWINGLVDQSGNYLPHLLPVDQTLHWANPPGGDMGKDMRGYDPTPYTGPVPIITHVHGAHVGPESDGYPEAWYLPNAVNIPMGYATQGTHYDQFDRSNAEPGTAVFQYPNDQNATTLWYHDHTLGMTRLNVYAGPAGFYLLRGGRTDLPSGQLPGPAPGPADPPGTAYYEIPIAIQDRSFYDDGSLFYPADRAFFEGLQPNQLRIPFIPDDACFGQMSDVSPIWNPEFFGNTIVVNGRTWPVLTVEPRRYRFRLLDGTDGRFLILKLVMGDPAVRPGVPALPFWQIGAEGGFLHAAVQLFQLLMAPAERADVIVDFTGLAQGTEVYMINEGPDEPFGGGVPGVDFPYADPNTTGQVMKFVVGPLKSADTSLDPATGALVLPRFRALGPADNLRQVTLNEADSETVLVRQNGPNLSLNCQIGSPFGPIHAKLGTLDSDGYSAALGWDAATTETPILNTTEIWEIFNFTADAHPIHIHLVQFQVVDRQILETDVDGMAVQPAMLEGDPVPPESWETGYKDTVIAYPGQVTRVKAKFDVAGVFVWHCHIIEHEDNEMMRAYEVVPGR